jgi:hypothetical protein
METGQPLTGALLGGGGQLFEIGAEPAARQLTYLVRTANRKLPGWNRRLLCVNSRAKKRQ